MADTPAPGVQPLRGADPATAARPARAAQPQDSASPPPDSAFEWPVRVYWEDTDAGGVVFHANYLKFFERSRTEWLRSLGLAQQRLKDETGGMFVITDAQLRYHRPTRLDDELIVTTEVLKLGRASMHLHQQARLKTERADLQSAPLLCEATIRIGWVQAASMQAARIPAQILDRLTTC